MITLTLFISSSFWNALVIDATLFPSPSRRNNSTQLPQIDLAVDVGLHNILKFVFQFGYWFLIDLACELQLQLH